MMSLSSLYLLFFAITVGAFAPAEAGSEPLAVNTPGAPSPVTFALLADQQQRNNKVTPVQKESPLGSGQQKRPLANVLAMAGAAAVIVALVLFFMKQMKGYLEKEKQMKPEDMVDKPKKLRDLTDEEELELERRFLGSEMGTDDEAMTADEIDAEAKRRIEKRREICEGLRWVAGSEGRTRAEREEKAFKEEAFDRAVAERKRRGREIDDEWRADHSEHNDKEWNRRQALKAALIAEIDGKGKGKGKGKGVSYMRVSAAVANLEGCILCGCVHRSTLGGGGQQNLATS